MKISGIFKEEEFDLYTGLNKDPRLYFKFIGRKDGLEILFNKQEIEDIQEWCGRCLERNPSKPNG